MQDCDLKNMVSLIYVDTNGPKRNTRAVDPDPQSNLRGKTLKKCKEIGRNCNLIPEFLPFEQSFLSCSTFHTAIYNKFC